MTKLNQIIALAGGRKSRSHTVVSEAHHKLQKRDLLTGIARTYQPRTEDGESLPAESKRVQFTVRQAIDEVTPVLAELFDTVATQDNSNCMAKADVIVDGAKVLTGVPVTHLLFLEKQLTDVSTFVGELPTLDPAYEWTFDKNTGSYRTPESETTRTKKVLRNHVKYEATKEHPAQVEVFTEDEIAGTWSKVEFSGAIPATEKQAALVRVRKLQEAVKLARETANNTEVVDLKTGTPVLQYIFGANGAN
jgi:hypothetical protein